MNKDMISLPFQRIVRIYRDSNLRMDVMEFDSPFLNTLADVNQH